VRSLRGAARAKGLQLQILKASTDSEIAAALTALVQLHAGALIVGVDPFFDGRGSSSRRWHCAMPFQRFMGSANTLPQAG